MTVTSHISPEFVTLGLFIIDEFSYADENGKPLDISVPPQIGGGGTYAAIGARIWLPANKIGMIIDEGNDFPEPIKKQLFNYGAEMWMFRQQHDTGTTRALNAYKGDHREFQYLTPRIRLTPEDTIGTKLQGARMLHFICSPARALEIVLGIKKVDGWQPVTIYEPIPVHTGRASCLGQGVTIHPGIEPSPNAEEALSLLSMPLPVTKSLVEEAASRFLAYGVGNGEGSVVIRCGAMGAYLKTSHGDSIWVDAFWSADDSTKVVDVTGAGNSFLGGFAAGLSCTGSVSEAVLYATVSASFIVEQAGLPILSQVTPRELWNGDAPERRLKELRKGLKQ